MLFYIFKLAKYFGIFCVSLLMIAYSRYVVDVHGSLMIIVLFLIFGIYFAYYSVKQFIKNLWYLHKYGK